MLARVRATGKIIEVKSKVISSVITGEYLLKYVDQETGVSYFEEELFFPRDSADDLDYWTKLEHQYAGMALQGMLANANHYLWERKQNYKSLVANAAEVAHALVEKYKEEERK